MFNGGQIITYMLTYHFSAAEQWVMRVLQLHILKKVFNFCRSCQKMIWRLFHWNLAFLDYGVKNHNCNITFFCLFSIYS